VKERGIEGWEDTGGEQREGQEKIREEKEGMEMREDRGKGMESESKEGVKKIVN